MITLVALDRSTHCLDRPDGEDGLYVCRLSRGHDGPHDYLPLDMVIIASKSGVEDQDDPCPVSGKRAVAALFEKR